MGFFEKTDVIHKIENAVYLRISGVTPLTRLLTNNECWQRKNKRFCEDSNLIDESAILYLLKTFN